jgi:predicted nucleic acid-binding protein
VAKLRTYVDTGVLIRAFRGTEEESSAALKIIADDSRSLVFSQYSLLETLPKARFNRQQREVDFYGTIFGSGEVIASERSLTEKAIELGATYGLGNIDALHASAAIAAGVDEFVTTEKVGKPFFRIKELRVTSLNPKASS